MFRGLSILKDLIKNPTKAFDEISKNGKNLSFLRRKIVSLNFTLIFIIITILICALNLSGCVEKTVISNNSTTLQLLNFTENIITPRQMQTNNSSANESSHINWGKERMPVVRENNKTIVIPGANESSWLHLNWTEEGIPVAKENNKTVIVPGASLLGIPIVEIGNQSITIGRGECVNDSIRFVPRNDGLANFTVKTPKVLRASIIPSKFYAKANVEYSLNLTICTLPDTPKGSYKLYVYIDYPIQPPPRRYKAYTWIVVNVK